LGSFLKVDDFGHSCIMKCFLTIGAETIAILDDTTKEVIFTTTCKSVIGWTAQHNRWHHHLYSSFKFIMTSNTDKNKIIDHVTRL